MNCRNCNIDISNKTKNVFCSKSCSASFNNRKRKLSPETKNKIKKGVIKWCLKNKLKIKEYRCCKFCDINFISKSSNRVFCSDLCRKNFRRKNLSEYQKYKKECQFNFNVFNFPKEFDLKKIKKYGFYKAKNRGDNLNGISRDHIYSIRDGFDNNISSKIISHPANCNLLRHCKNSVKHRKSFITIIDLKKRIEIWNKKYK